MKLNGSAINKHQQLNKSNQKSDQWLTFPGKLRGSTIEQIFEVVFVHGETIVQTMNICHRISRIIFITYGHCTTDTFL